MPDWLSRYNAGHREAVWHELRQLGAQVRSPDRLDEARAVCHGGFPGRTTDREAWRVRRRLAEGLLPL